MGNVGETGETVAFEKAPQNFCEKENGFSLCKSGQGLFCIVRWLWAFAIVECRIRYRSFPVTHVFHRTHLDFTNIQKGEGSRSYGTFPFSSLLLQ